MLPSGNKLLAKTAKIIYMIPYGCIMKTKPDTSALERALRSARAVQDAYDVARGSPIQRAAQEALERSRELERLIRGSVQAPPEALRMIEDRVQRAALDSDPPGVRVARQIDRGFAEKALAAANAVNAAQIGSPITRAVEALSRGYAGPPSPQLEPSPIANERRAPTVRARTSTRSEPSTASVELQSTADLGELIRARRLSMGLSQQAFADFAGVGRRFISELEAGKPTAEFGRVLKVCRAAGVQLTAA